MCSTGEKSKTPQPKVKDDQKEVKQHITNLNSDPKLVWVASKQKYLL